MHSDYLVDKRTGEVEETGEVIVSYDLPGAPFYELLGKLSEKRTFSPEYDSERIQTELEAMHQRAFNVGRLLTSRELQERKEALDRVRQAYLRALRDIDAEHEANKEAVTELRVRFGVDKGAE